MVPSQYPIISYSPTSVPTKASCHNYDGWSDIFGNDCMVYEIYDEPGCPVYGSDYAAKDGIYKGMTAVDACCKFLSLSLKMSAHYVVVIICIIFELM